MRSAERLLAGISRVERFVAFLAFLLLVAVVFVDVVNRELSGTGLHWALQIGVYANFVVVMLGIGVASAGGSHLRPQFADRWLPRRLEPVLVRLQEVVTSLFFLGFAVAGVTVVEESRLLGERAPVLGNLIWPLQGLIPAVFLLATIRHGLYAVWPALRPLPASAFPAEADRR
ncbi:MAG: TRAP transporter small permease subunit [Gammaproteobacteria bacterium]|nr:TRAP transporter small permease subunit [Gammaproteobacteria bacterium]